MLQDIEPSELNNQYKSEKPTDTSYILCFDKRSVMWSEKKGFPTYADFNNDKENAPEIIENKKEYDKRLNKFIYLFRIDGQTYFLYPEFEEKINMPGYDYISVQEIRVKASKKECFAASTGLHLYVWYKDNRFCGRCGGKLIHDEKTRMLRCNCGNMVFPKIAPAVIVGVIDQEKQRIVMTKYADREYKKYALIAGFNEIGETPEDTVKREVMEEVGLKIKNIRYYKSQPWGFDCNLLMGYFADLDGSDKIVRDEEELAVATWMSKEELQNMDDGISLTREMIRYFAEK